MAGYGEWSIERWEQMFDEIYGRKNRGKSPKEIWFRMIEEVSELVKPVENQKYGVIENELPDLFAWLMAFTRSYDMDLQSSLWQKFEDGCPTCGEEKDCNCFLEPDDFQKKRGREEDLDHYSRPTTLQQWQVYLEEIYGEANERFTPELILSKLVEDIGIVAKYLRRNESDERIEWKLSSVFAWTIGLCNRYSAEGDRIELWELVAEKYDSRCAKCKKNPCECDYYLSSIFISYPVELESLMEAAKEYLESVDFDVYVFPELSRDMSEGRLFEAFSAIDKSDAGLVLLGDRFSSPVYAEYHELRYNKNRDLVFCYAQKSDGERESDQVDFIDEIRKTHKALPFEDEEEFMELLERDIQDAKSKARRIGY